MNILRNYRWTLIMALCGVALVATMTLTGMPAPGIERTAATITERDMRPVASVIAVRKCERETYMTVRGVPVKIYVCVFAFTHCRWHPPFKRNVGACSIKITVAPRKRSLLPDRSCITRIIMVKRVDRTVPVNPQGPWKCYNDGYSGGQGPANT